MRDLGTGNYSFSVFALVLQTVVPGPGQQTQQIELSTLLFEGTAL